MAKKVKLKAKGLKQQFAEAYGKMKSDRMKERKSEKCSCGGKGCEKCDCG